MQDWICICECFKYSMHLFVGDFIQSEENPRLHFTLLDGLEGVFSPTGRKFLIRGWPHNRGLGSLRTKTV
jgi:hypothetical protein